MDSGVRITGATPWCVRSRVPSLYASIVRGGVYGIHGSLRVSSTIHSGLDVLRRIRSVIHVLRRENATIGFHIVGLRLRRVGLGLGGGLSIEDVVIRVGVLRGDRLSTVGRRGTIPSAQRAIV